MFAFIDNQTRRRARTVLAMFAIGIIAGAIASFYYPELMDQILDSFRDRFGEKPDLDGSLAWEIFQQNIMVSTLAWLGGILLGAIPATIVLANGFILGYVTTHVLAAPGGLGQGMALIIFGLLPHGILEIPAFLGAAAIGLRLGLDWLSQPAKGHRLSVLWNTFKATAQIFGFLILVLALAAVVEVFVSGRIVNNY